MRALRRPVRRGARAVARRSRIALTQASAWTQCLPTPKERVIAINKRIVELGRDRRLSDALAQLESLTAQKLRPTWSHSMF